MTMDMSDEDKKKLEQSSEMEMETEGGSHGASFYDRLSRAQREEGAKTNYGSLSTEEGAKAYDQAQANKSQEDEARMAATRQRITGRGVIKPLPKRD